MKKRVLVGMSGGVDSSVAALLLQQQGYEVIGAFMKNWSKSVPGLEQCSWREDRFDARRVAVQLDIPLLTLDFEKEYTARVFEPFLREYEQGRTPNPDILCNREMKFGKFLEFAKSIGATAVATGHYARIFKNDDGAYSLHKGRDATKDQSYFLYTLSSAQLSSMIFPIGERLKSEVRDIARAYGLSTADKKDSQGICFVGNVELQTFLKNYIPTRPGNVVNEQGKVVATHEGQSYYTIGQRHGLKQSGGMAMYVTKRDPQTNTVTVVTGSQHPSLFHRALAVREMAWVNGRPPRVVEGITAKVRYRQDDQAVKAITKNGKEIIIAFQTPQRAITPGQSVVVYKGDEVLGGGIIDSPVKTP